MRPYLLSLMLVLACRAERPGTTFLKPSDARELPTRAAAPPIVEDADGLLAHGQQWVELRGRLTQWTWPESAKAREFTQLTLDDGARVTVTYGDPPSGWEPLVERRVAVVGLLTLCGRWEMGQTLSGPHLQMWETPRVLDAVVVPPVTVDAAAVSKRISDHCLGR